MQALTYVIPAILCGLLLSVGGNKVVQIYLQDSIHLVTSVLPTANSLLLSVLVALLIPVLSSAYPIYAALRQSLSESVDVNHSKTAAIKIRIDLEGKGIPWDRITFGVFCSVFGLAIYYFLPISLYKLNIGLMITIFFWIIAGFFAGLVLLSLNVQYLLERVVVHTCLWWSRSWMKQLILKNLAAHRLKNRRTAVMYGISLSFTIFIWSTAMVQMTSIAYSVKQYQGSYLNVQQYGFVSAGTEEAQLLSPAIKLEEALKQHLADEVLDYSWITQDLNSFLTTKGIHSIYVTHLGQIFKTDPVSGSAQTPRAHQ